MRVCNIGGRCLQHWRRNFQQRNTIGVQRQGLLYLKQPPQPSCSSNKSAHPSNQAHHLHPHKTAQQQTRPALFFGHSDTYRLAHAWMQAHTTATHNYTTTARHNPHQPSHTHLHNYTTTHHSHPHLVSPRIRVHIYICITRVKTENLVPPEIYVFNRLF